MSFPVQINSLLKRLSTKQRKAVELLTLTEKTIDEVAASCKIAPSTLWRWRHQNEDFQKCEIAMTAWSCSELFLKARRDWAKQIESGNWKASEKALDYGFALAGQLMGSIRAEDSDDSDA